MEAVEGFGPPRPPNNDPAEAPPAELDGGGPAGVVDPKLNPVDGLFGAGVVEPNVGAVPVELPALPNNPLACVVVGGFAGVPKLNVFCLGASSFVSAGFCPRLPKEKVGAAPLLSPPAEPPALPNRPPPDGVFDPDPNNVDPDVLPNRFELGAELEAGVPPKLNFGASDMVEDGGFHSRADAICQSAADARFDCDGTKRSCLKPGQLYSVFQGTVSVTMKASRRQLEPQSSR